MSLNRSGSCFIAGVMLGLLLSTVAFSLWISPDRSSVEASQQLVLKLGHGLDVMHPVHKAMVFMKERLEVLSGGTVTIDIYPGSVLGSEVQCIEQLQNGSLAMTKTSAAAIENFVPAMSVFSLPYVFRDTEHYWAVLNGEIGQKLLQQGETKFLRGLCYYEAGRRHFYTKKTPIRTPDDLDGLKIRVMNNKTSVDMAKAMGASATPIAWGELYSALAQGIVDGAENNLPSFVSNKHYEICKHLALDGHTQIPDMMLISTKIWDKLEPKVQAWLSQAAIESVVYQRDLWDKTTIEAMEKAKAEGVTIYDVPVSLFANKVAPMLDAVENSEVRDLLKQISGVK